MKQGHSGPGPDKDQVLYVADAAGDGGATILYLEDGTSVSVSPVAGDALVFGQSFKLGRSDCDHSQYALKHEGSPMKQPSSKSWMPEWFTKKDDESRGDEIQETKYVLRSDVLYRLPSTTPTAKADV